MAFSIVPLLEIRTVKPSLLLRDVDARKARDPLRWLMASAVGAVLFAVAIWQAGSVQLGALVAAGVVATGGLLHLSGGALIRALAPLVRVRWFPLRHAVLKLIRPGNQTRLVLLAVGLGSFLTLGVRSLQELLIRDLSVDLQHDAPDMFLLDVQADQLAPLREVLRAHRDPRSSPERVIPILRARVTGVEGRTIRLEDYEDVRERGSLGREYTITYRAHLERNERVLAGRFWNDAPSGEGEVSIEQSLQERHGIGIGDTIRFDVLGRSVSARVTSVRSVNWTDARAGGFMFVFRPGLLDKAPHSYVGFLRGPGDSAARARLQNALLDRLPNVSVVDGRDMLGTLRRIVDTISLAVSAVGSLVVLSGLLILIGAVMMTKYRRAYDVAIFKTLGATRRLMFTALLLEYTALGAIAGCVGALAAMALTFAVSRFGFDLAWHPLPGLSALGIAISAALVGVVGVAASAGVVSRKPLSTLKSE
jgi:putative ABC transport system permease protein